ncbi:MAG: hypothetical protein K8L91_03705 [Anaerolineae bacterium]|nr:hypothetical protein [Anaerolineae bacterium]
MVYRLLFALFAIAQAVILPTPPLSYAQESACLTHVPNFDTTVRIGRGSIDDMALSPDGTQVGVATGTGLWVYDAATWGDIAQFKASVSGVPLSDGVWVTPPAPIPPEISPPDGYVPTTLAWSPDSKQIAAGYYDGVRIWEVGTGQVALILPNLRQVTHVAWSPDGARLAIIHLGNVSPYPDATTYYDIYSLEIASQTLTPVAVGVIRNPDEAVWSPDGTRLLYVSSYGYTPAEEIMDYVPAIGAATIWDSSDGTSRTFTSTNPSGYFNVRQVAWSPDGSTIAIGAIEGENNSRSLVQWWDVASLGLLRQNEEAVKDLQWAGETLFIQADSGVLLVNGDSTSSLSISGGAQQIAVNADATRLFVNSGSQMQTLEIPSGQILATRAAHTSLYFFPAWSQDGQLVALSELSLDRDSVLRQVFIYDLQGQVVNSFDINYGHNGMVWSPDNAMLAVAEYDAVALVTLADNGITRLAVEDVNGLAWSPDNRQLAYITDAGDVTVYTIQTGESQTFAALLDDLAGTATYLNTRLQWTEHGLHWILSARGSIFRVYGPEWETGETVQLAEIGHLKAISLGTAPEFTADGNVIFIPNGGDMTVFDVTANAISATYPTTAEEVRWSSDGACYALMLNGFLWLNHTVTGEELNLMALPVSPVWGLYGGAHWSPTGMHVIFLLDDGTAMIWGVGQD